MKSVTTFERPGLNDEDDLEIRKQQMKRIIGVIFACCNIVVCVVVLGSAARKQMKDLKYVHYVCRKKLSTPNCNICKYNMEMYHFSI